ncbi:MAG TPA: hypothetical protein VF614_05810, partial [Chthoniobacteraceae bacterium]
FLAAFLLVACSAAVAAEPAKLVVAIRYLQSNGVSHSHLYLYREDGRLLRQLTKNNPGQDFDPLFAENGETIVFTRELDGDTKQFWSVSSRGGQPKQLSAAPDWYTAAKTSPHFTRFQEKSEIEAETPASNGTEKENDSPAGPPPTFRAPDGSVEVVAQKMADDEDDAMNLPGTGKHFLLRDLKAGTEVKMGTLPGFVGLRHVLPLQGSSGGEFLFQGALRVIFFTVHLNSTDGDTNFALDLNTRKIVRLSPNWAAPMPLPGKAAFLTLTSERYLPIPGTKKTANCSFLERWDAKLDKVRYARPGAAAICYGASVYLPGQTPATVNFRRDEDY